MADIFDEIQEDLRAERAEKLLRKYAWLIAVAAVAIVAAAAGWQLWDRWQRRQDNAAAVRYVSVQNAIERPDASKAGQMSVLNELASAGPPGYKVLSRLRAADLKDDAGDLAGATTLRNEVAADPNVDGLLRDVATLQATQRDLDHGDPLQLEARLRPLSAANDPWNALAQEQLAILDLRQGKLDDARRKLQMLSVDVDAPAGARTRASALLASLGSPSGQ